MTDRQGSPVSRRIAGWALLSLVPATFVVLAILAGELAEMAVGTAIALGLGAAIWFGIDRHPPQRPQQLAPGAVVPAAAPHPNDRSLNMSDADFRPLPPIVEGWCPWKESGPDGNRICMLPEGHDEPCNMKPVADD